MNNYLFHITSYRYLEEEINKITKGIDNVIKMNFDDISVNDIINECLYCSFLDDKKCVIVYNFPLNSETKNIEKYLNNPNENVKLILVTNKIDKRNTTYKIINDKNGVIEKESLTGSELSNKVSNYAKNIGLNIDYNTLNLLMSNNLENYDLILNELDKLSIVSKDITSDVLDKYSSKILSDDSFELCDAITSKDYKKINKLVNNFILNKKEVIPFISLLASSYRIIYSIFNLNDSNEEIGFLLKIHPYRVKLARDKSKLYSKSELEDIIVRLANYDYELKSSNINEYILLKQLLIELK